MFAMIGVRFSSILILIKLAVAQNPDGFCTFVETYSERVTYIITFRHRVAVTLKCGFFNAQTCYEYRDQVKSELAAKNVLKSRFTNKCCDGYIPINKKCKPVCKVPCFNGLCTEPNVCTCSSGYHKNEKEMCVKNECDPESDDCLNGTCTSNGVCTCNEGFVKSESDLLSSVKSKCQPKCSDGCLNGICVSPEQCVCNSGYKALNSSVCSPICMEACLYGTCTEPNKCTCFKGYQLQSGSNQICNPVCSSCLNGKCVKPEFCLCDKGFQLSEESKQCEPFCDVECVNSNCTSPNICTCEVGFTQSNATHCEIVCENCNHGYCEEPNVCQCDVGYHMNIEKELCVQNECTSDIMEDSCENGYCSEFICECNSGYEKNASSACAPYCSLDCVNGYCSAPEVCQCNLGYGLGPVNVTDDGNCTNCTSLTQWNVCNAICEDCKSGVCTEGVCNCSVGHVQHPRNRGKCVATADLIYSEKEIQSNNDTITITMSLLGIVIICVVSGLAYWRYAMWKRNSYTCSSGALYQKNKDSTLLFRHPVPTVLDDGI